MRRALYEGRDHAKGVIAGESAMDKAKIAVAVACRGLVLAGLPGPLGRLGAYRFVAGGRTWQAPAGGRANYLYATVQSPEEGEALCSAARGTCIDVGAGIGWFTVPLAQRLGDRGRVVAIEPHEPSYWALSRNTAGLTNVLLLRCAVGARDGTATLFEPPPRLGGLSISMHYHRGRPFSVPLRSIDSLRDELGIVEVGLVKIDVEGAEPEVLAGMRGVLRDCTPDVAFEALSKEAYDACVAILAPFGYHVELLHSSASVANYMATAAPATTMSTGV